MDWLTAHWQELLSLAGVLVAIYSGLAYIKTILAGESKPHRVTWGGWALVGMLGLLSSHNGGAGVGLAVAATYVLITIVVFALSLIPKYGKAGGTKIEFIAGAVAAITLLTQLFIDYSPAVGATIAIVADIVFLWPTLKAAWLQPDTEALYPWVLGVIAVILGTLALGNYSYAASAYSFYILIGDSAIVVALMIQKPKHASRKAKKTRAKASS